MRPHFALLPRPKLLAARASAFRLLAAGLAPARTRRPWGSAGSCGGTTTTSSPGPAVTVAVAPAEADSEAAALGRRRH